jgi:hypothetical protein
MEVSGQVQTPAALFPEKFLLPTDYQNIWA